MLDLSTGAAFNEELFPSSVASGGLIVGTRKDYGPIPNTPSGLVSVYWTANPPSTNVGEVQAGFSFTFSDEGKGAITMNADACPGGRFTFPGNNLTVTYGFANVVGAPGNAWNFRYVIGQSLGGAGGASSLNATLTLGPFTLAPLATQPAVAVPTFARAIRTYQQTINASLVIRSFQDDALAVRVNQINASTGALAVCGFDRFFSAINNSAVTTSIFYYVFDLGL